MASWNGIKHDPIPGYYNWTRLTAGTQITASGLPYVALADADADDEGWLLLLRRRSSPGQPLAPLLQRRLVVFVQDAEIRYFNLHDPRTGQLQDRAVQPVPADLAGLISDLLTVERTRLEARGHRLHDVSWTSHHHDLTYDSALWGCISLRLQCVSCEESVSYRANSTGPLRGLTHKRGRLLTWRRCRGRPELPEELAVRLAEEAERGRRAGEAAARSYDRVLERKREARAQLPNSDVRVVNRRPNRRPLNGPA